MSIMVSTLVMVSVLIMVKYISHCQYVNYGQYTSYGRCVNNGHIYQSLSVHHLRPVYQCLFKHKILVSAQWDVHVFILLFQHTMQKKITLQKHCVWYYISHVTPVEGILTVYKHVR